MRRVRFNAALVAILVAFVAVPSVSTVAQAETFSVPEPPSNVHAQVTAQGIRVTWDASPAASPAITKYVVHAGPNSCPVTVPRSATSATMPLVKGPKTVSVSVQAVNEYGFSSDATAAPIKVISKPSSNFRNVQILEFSDLHGAIEQSSSSIGAAVLAGAFKRDRKAVASTFVASAGDSIGGAPVISSQFEERPTIEALNLMGLDVSTLGNHEHDRSLAHLRSMIDLSQFPWVESSYTSLTPLIGQRNRVRPYVVLERGGVKVGFIGLNTGDLPVRVSKNNLVDSRAGSITIDDSTAHLQRSIDAAKAAGAQFIVALAHRGWDANESGKARGPLLEIARRLRGVDVVFGGDSHLQYASVLGNAAVVQVPNSGQMYSRVIVCLDTTRNQVLGASVGFVKRDDVNNIPAVPAVVSEVEKYKAALADKLDVRIGTVDSVFPRGGNPPVERSQEIAMGDFATDALRNKYGTNFALINGGGVRDTLPASGYRPTDNTLRRPTTSSSGPYDVTLGDLVSVFPFSDEVSTTTITGANLWKALENGVSKWPSDGRFPQVSGFSFTFNPTLPVGSRVLSVIKDDGSKIAQDNATYSISTSTYLVAGGDGYDNVFSTTHAIVRDTLPDVVLEALRNDLAAGKVTMGQHAGNRIRMVR